MEWKIEKQSAIPLYFQLKQLVLGGIEQGILSPGDMIPTEQELSAMLGISRPTIRQALGELVNEGYLTRVKSKGTFISSPKLDAQFFQRLQPFAQELEQKGRKPSTQVLSLEKSEARPDANAALELDKNAAAAAFKAPARSRRRAGGAGGNVFALFFV